jgi:protease-4
MMADENRFKEGMRKLFLPITAPLRFIQEHFKAMIFLLLLFVIFAPSNEQSLLPNNLQHIALKGPIFDAGEIVHELDTAAQNRAVKGVLVDVSSPGGAVAPSVEISYAIKRLREEKPVVVYASGVCASGGYYASIWADRIIANPGSMVGSIGVIMQGADFSGLMEKLGVKAQVVSAGRYKQLGTADREWTPEEREELEKVIHGTYELFVGDVAQARNLDPAQHSRYADAHIFTAQQAKEVGLVDEVGVRYDAEQELIRLSGVEKPVWNEEDRFEKIMRKLTAEGMLMLNTYFPAVSLR